jgi:hypothetical protein
VPRQGQWVRREGRPGAPAPQINEAASVISSGKVRGEISAAAALPAAGVSRLNVAIVAGWGETLASRAILVPAENAAGPWPFELVDVPAFNNLRVSVAYVCASPSPMRARRESALWARACRSSCGPI